MKLEDKKYVCECGKVYANSQSFNGHKSSCKIHLTAVGKPITQSSLYNPESQAKAHATLAKQYAEKRELATQQWVAEAHTCEKCGKVMLEKFGSGRFCSRACANTRVPSAETKLKQSIATKANAAKKCTTSTKNSRVANVKREPTSILDLSKRTVSKVILRMQLPCSCCGVYVPGVVWDIHHIKPRSQGGSDSADNLTYICPNCHRICHTDASLLVKPLISLVDFLKSVGKRWQDYYFAKATPCDLNNKG